MIETIDYNYEKYPKYNAMGNASQFAIPFALHVCKGQGYDIGYCKEEWKYPGAQGIDEADNNEWHAMNLPKKGVDYIYSSHCLEHLPNWVDALDYWIDHLAIGGTLFLYLPHKDQSYWLPWNNRKHVHALDEEVIEKYLWSRDDMDNIFVSQRDLNWSFMVMAEKCIKEPT